MSHDLIHDRGRGPELIGTRITVYNLFPDFLDPSRTDEEICRIYSLTAAQVAAVRAYILLHPEEVLANHLRIEERLAAGNPPEVRAQAAETRKLFLRYNDWLEARQRDEEHWRNVPPLVAGNGPTFKEWLAERSPSRAG